MIFTLPLIFIIDRYFNIKNCRWFFLHAITNFLVSLVSVKSVIACIKDPVNMKFEKNLQIYDINSIYNFWPSDLILSLHIYHILFFKLKNSDIFHHLVFIPFCMLNICNNIKNICAFFTCGFPGFITYISLILSKNKYIYPLTEKKISVFQNMFLRMPGILFFVFSIVYSKLYNREKNEESFYKIFVVCVFSIFNSFYYLQQIIGSYYLKKRS